MSADTSTSTPLEAQADRLGHLLWRLVRTLRAFETSDRACCGVTPAQCCALLAFTDREEMAMTELADRLGLAVSTATRLVDSLTRDRLAERRRPADDRRTVLVRLTRAGQERTSEIRKGRRERLAQVLAEIPGERRDEVVSVVEQLLGALVSEDPPCCSAE